MVAGPLMERADRIGPFRKACAMLKLQSNFSGKVGDLTDMVGFVTAPSSSQVAIKGKVIVIDANAPKISDLVINRYIFGDSTGISPLLDSFQNKFDAPELPRLSAVNLCLPDGILATNLAEATTVVLLSWDSEYYSTYSQQHSGTPSQIAADLVTCNMSIINRKDHWTYLNVSNFRGSPPPENVFFSPSQYSSVIYGNVPYEDIAAFLRALPNISD